MPVADTVSPLSFGGNSQEGYTASWPITYLSYKVKFSDFLLPEEPREPSLLYNIDMRRITPSLMTNWSPGAGSSEAQALDCAGVSELHETERNPTHFWALRFSIKSAHLSPEAISIAWKWPLESFEEHHSAYTHTQSNRSQLCPIDLKMNSTTNYRERPFPTAFSLEMLWSLSKNKLD